MERMREVYEVISFEVFCYSNDYIIHLSQRKHFSWSLHLLKSEILDCRAVELEKKGQFRKVFFGSFKILEHPFLSEHFQNASVVQSSGRL